MTRARKDKQVPGKTNLPQTNELMPGLRPRHDGWTRERTRIFLATLGQTGCVRDACRVAGCSSTGAYRMQKRFPLFAAEWDRALARAHRGLQAIAWQRAVEGKETIIIRKGEEVERRISPDSSILALLLKQGKMEGGLAEIADPDKVITLAEWRAGWRFTEEGEKYNPEDNRVYLAEKLSEKIHKIRLNLEQHHGGQFP